MGPGQHEAPTPTRPRISSISFGDERRQPPSWFVGIVNRPSGRREIWRYGRRIISFRPKRGARRGI